MLAKKRHRPVPFRFVWRICAIGPQNLIKAEDYAKNNQKHFVYCSNSAVVVENGFGAGHMR